MKMSEYRNRDTRLLKAIVGLQAFTKNSKQSHFILGISINITNLRTVLHNLNRVGKQ